MPLSIAFKVIGDHKWRAGTTILVDLLHALRAAYGRDVRLYLLTFERPESVPADLAQCADGVLAYPEFRRWTPTWLVNRATHYALHWDVLGERLLQRHRVDALAFGFLKAGARIPAVGFVPDFQHVHFPEWFTDDDVQERRAIAEHTARAAARIMTLSDSVTRDFAAFAPQYAHKAGAVRPVSHLPAHVYQIDIAAVLGQYHLPDTFIYLPNQFWRHKNHVAVFEAMRVLRDRGIDVFCVCTGYPWDYRDPGHFADVLQKLSLWGLRDRVALLGVAPRDAVFALIRQSVCVVNPSLFEGYGLSVQEARSVGKRVLVSDIPAHREQDPPRAEFVDPRDVDALADKLAVIWREAPPGPDAELEQQAREDHPRRVREFADAFVELVRAAVDA